MKYFLRYLKPHVLTMCFGFFIKFSGTIMDLLIPYILSYIIDEVTPKNDIGLVVRWGLLMILCAALVLLANVWANRIASAVSRDVIHALRYDLFYRISYLSGSQVDFFTIPSLVTRMTSDTYNLHRMLNMIQRMGVRAPILFLGGIAITMAIDPYLSAILCVLLPFMILVVAYISKKSIPLFIQAQKSADNMIRVVRENSTGIRVIKALSKVEYERGRFDSVNRGVIDREMTAGLTMAVTNPSVNLILNLGLTLIIIAGAYRVNSGVSLPGAIIAFMSYFTIILNAMMSVNRMFIMYSRGSASAARIAEVLDTPEDLLLQPAEPEAAAEDAHVAFSHVNFAYPGMEATLRDISFSLKKGETLGIIGATGSGKTAILNLQELYPKFGIVFQHDVLFAQSIAENIAFGREIPRERIEAAARDAQALEFIDALPDRFDHQLEIKGSNLSGGQKQRLLIARALAGKPEILILDDASSALDYKTDSQLRAAIREHYAGTTTVIVAQRVSSILHADHILVLEEGREIGYGTHAELLESCESYREISQSQMGGVIDG